MTVKEAETTPSVRHYYVDEAGDAVLFAGRGTVLVGRNCVSRHFILGCLDVPDPKALHKDLEKLRATLLADPLLKSAPSMRPETRKTAVSFHAKDDLPEVRHQVFNTILRHPVKFYAVVRDKQALLSFVRLQNEKGGGYRYNENEVYDALVAHLFRDRLHRADSHIVTFAGRGKRERNEALRKALEKARRNFYLRWGRAHHGPIDVATSTPGHAAGLQAVDYFLWAVQRAFEKGEDRFITAIWSHVRLVMDIDDTRKATYGAHYDAHTPLTAEAISRDGGE